MPVPLIAAPIFGGIPHLRHGFTTREGGVSAGRYASLNLGWDTGDDDESVNENYERLAETLGARSDRLFGIRQIHGNGVIPIQEGGSAEESFSRNGDILVTHVPGAFLYVRVADCYPILICSPERHVIAAVHAGWRGTLAGATRTAINALKHTYACEPSGLKVAIGPGISRAQYQISFGVLELFRAQAGLTASELDERGSGPRIDLAAINRRQALEAGVRAESIWSSNLCSFDDSRRFYSYRRDGKQSGRMVGVIGWTA